MRLSSSKNLVPGIEKYPDLRRRFLADYRAAEADCCVKSTARIVQRYNALVAQRKADR